MPVRLKPSDRPVRKEPCAPEPGGLLDDAPDWMRVLAYALGAAGVSASLVVTPVFAAWLANTSSTVPAGQAISLGLLGWLMAHGVPLHLGRGSVELIPWLLTLLPLMTVRWSAQRLLLPAALRRPRVRPQGWIRADIAALGGGFCAVYALVAFLVATLARLPGASASPLVAAFAAAVLAGLGVTWAATDLFAGRFDRLCPRLADGWVDHAPVWLRHAIRPAARGVAALCALGAVGVVVLMAFGASRVGSLYADLGPGWVGGTVLTLGQLLYLPTAAAWAVAVAAGPGFAIGAGPGVSVRGIDGGALPLVPAFGALPDPGPLPGWFLGVLAVPVLVGAVVGWQAISSGARLGSWRSRAATIGAACGLTGVTMTLVFALTSGALGVDRLGHVGPSPLLAGAALLGELLLGGLLALAVSPLRVRRIPRPRRRRARDD